MKVLEWFDYMYYRTYKIYTEKWKETMPRLYATGVVSVIEVFNIEILFFAGLIFTESSYRLGSLYTGVFFFTVFFLNQSRYSGENSNYSALRKKWENESPVLQRKKGVWVIVHIALFFLVAFSLAAILGEMKKSSLAVR